ncbi:MAG: PIN domain nuclease [Sphingobacteriaceae bacterium]|nr:MAG: PIN domain nuclease [Sphingobacteriaceae bacterium]
MMSPTNNDILLVDTSVWINVFKGIATKNSIFLKENTNVIPIAVCPVIVQEVLQGVTIERDIKFVESYFETLIRLNNEQYNLATKAAELYRMLRKKGITIRKPNDCLIAMYAIHNDTYLIQDDRDFIFIAENSDLKLL